MPNNVPGAQARPCLSPGERWKHLKQVTMLYTETTVIALRETGDHCVHRDGYVVELYDLHENDIAIRHCRDVDGLRRTIAPYVDDTDEALARLLPMSAH